MIHRVRIYQFPVDARGLGRNVYELTTLRADSRGRHRFRLGRPELLTTEGGAASAASPTGHGNPSSVSSIHTGRAER